MLKLDTRSTLVFEMTVTAQALQEIQGKNDWRDGSSNVFWKQTLTMPTWRSAVECSTVGQQRSEKLDRRWLKGGCVEQQAMMSMQSGDADEPRQQMTDGVPLFVTTSNLWNWCLCNDNFVGLGMPSMIQPSSSPYPVWWATLLVARRNVSVCCWS